MCNFFYILKTCKYTSFWEASFKIVFGLKSLYFLCPKEREMISCQEKNICQYCCRSESSKDTFLPSLEKERSCVVYN